MINLARQTYTVSYFIAHSRLVAYLILWLNFYYVTGQHRRWSHAISSWGYGGTRRSRTLPRGEAIAVLYREVSTEVCDGQYGEIYSQWYRGTRLLLRSVAWEFALEFVRSFFSLFVWLFVQIIEHLFVFKFTINVCSCISWCCIFYAPSRLKLVQ